MRSVSSELDGYYECPKCKEQGNIRRGIVDIPNPHPSVYDDLFF